MHLVKAIRSELIKLKYPPLLWLIGFVTITTLAIVFSAHYIDIHNSVRLGVNPWIRVSATGLALFSMFVGTPFVILLISALLFIEHQNLGFKQLYTLPKRREVLISYKLIAIFLTLIFTLLLLAIGLIAIGYLLYVIYPETEFTYYKLPLLAMLKGSGGYIISTLGIIGVQYFLAIRFKGFLVPASFGILAYIIGFILASIGNTLAFFSPYSYTMIATDNDQFGLSSYEIKQFGIFNEVQLYSLIFFFTFILMSFYLERNRNI